MTTYHIISAVGLVTTYHIIRAVGIVTTYHIISAVGIVTTYHIISAVGIVTTYHIISAVGIVTTYHIISAVGIVTTYHIISAVGIVTTPQSDWQVWNSNRVRGKGFFSSPNLSEGPWGPPSLLFNEYRASFPGLRRPGSKVNHLHTCTAQVRNEWSYTSTPPTCLHGVDREKFIFAFTFTLTNHDNCSSALENKGRKGYHEHGQRDNKNWTYFSLIWGRDS